MNPPLNSEELLAETESSEDQQGWLATFADLMSLLMCFFVLLLSFSELDVVKFKQIAGSMKTAFGVQREIIVSDVPLGTSIIAQEFSAGIPQPSILDEVKQSTNDRFTDQLAIPIPDRDVDEGKSGRDKRDTNPAYFELQQRLEVLLLDELNPGLFELDNNGQQLTIRFKEQGSFASGSGYLQPLMVPTLQSIAELLVDVPGQILVTGHTDNIPLKNELYEDNLALSTARALAVARVLKASHHLRFLKVMGAADAQPLVPNSNTENRAKNRRVEISINQGSPKYEVLSLPTKQEQISG